MPARCYRDRVMPPCSIRFDHIVFKTDAFRVVLLEPAVRSFFVHKNFEMAGIANTVCGVDIDPNSCHRSLFSLRFPQCLSFRDRSNTCSTCRFNALMTPMRANIGGPPFSATSNSASMAAWHSEVSCSAFGNSVMYSAVSRKVISFLPLGNTIGSKTV
jgi:hypothetical protein